MAALEAELQLEAWVYQPGLPSNAMAPVSSAFAPVDAAALAFFRDDAAFRKLFAKTAVKRTGRDRFIRNVLIAIGNSGDLALAPAAERLLSDASPMVRGAAVWALARLDPHRIATLAPQHAGEADPAVAEEWASATSATKV